MISATCDSHNETYCNNHCFVLIFSLLISEDFCHFLAFLIDFCLFRDFPRRWQYFRHIFVRGYRNAAIADKERKTQKSSLITL